MTTLFQCVKWKLVALFCTWGITLLLNGTWKALEPPTMGATVKAQMSNDVVVYAAGRAVQTSNWPLMWQVPCWILTLILIGFMVRDFIRICQAKENVK